MFLRSAVSFLSVMLMAAAANAAPMVHAGMKHTGVKTAKASASCSTPAYEAAMATMHARMNAPLSGNADVDFVRQMIPHHQGAVDMAKIQLRYGKNGDVKAFSRWVIRAQEQEIAAMQNWLERRDNGSTLANAQDYYGAAMMTMHHAMMIEYTGDADVDFVRGMIAHHQGALDMASIWFMHGSDPDLYVLANDIYTSQSGEIALMQRSLDAPASIESPMHVRNTYILAIDYSKQQPQR